MVHYLTITSRSRNELIDVTERVSEIVRASGVVSGVCHLFALHTTAGVTINEGADPAVRHDIARFLETLIPADARFSHTEGNSDSHVKTSLVGSSESVIIDGGRLLLGTWQAIFFCEFDGPRTRKLAVKIASDD